MPVGDYGSKSGHARVHEHIGYSWVKLFKGWVLCRMRICMWLLGHSAAFYSDDKNVAVGAYESDGNGSWTGHVFDNERASEIATLFSW